MSNNLKDFLGSENSLLDIPSRTIPVQDVLCLMEKCYELGLSAASNHIIDSTGDCSGATANHLIKISESIEKYLRCEVSLVSSCVCNKGTRGCVSEHKS